MYMGFYWRIYNGSYVIQKKVRSLKDASYLYKKVVQKNDDGKILAIFNSIKEAAYNIGVNYTSGISACLVGKLPHAHGFIWEYYKEKDYEG